MPELRDTITIQAHILIFKGVCVVNPPPPSESEGTIFSVVTGECISVSLERWIQTA